MTELLIKLFIGGGDPNEPEIRKKYGFLSGITGIFLNLCLFVGKLLAGIFSGAISIIADALNNLSDAGSSIVNMVGFKIANTPPDREHPFGHGRAEYISGLIISFIIVLMGVELVRGSFEKIFDPQMPDNSLFTFIILFLAIAVKLWMFVFNRKLGKKINSVSLKAAASDSISDVMATGAVIAGMGISMLFKVNIDGYIGLAVAGFIIFSGIKTAKESLSSLLGQMPDKDFVNRIKESVYNYDGIIAIHDLIVHNYGIGVSFVSFHAEVNSSMGLCEAHELVDKIERDFKDKFNCLVTIHIDPVDIDDEETVMLLERVRKIVGDIDGELSLHDFRVRKKSTGRYVIFDLSVPYKFRYSDAQVKDMIISAVKDTEKDIEVVIHAERQLSELD